MQGLRLGADRPEQAERQAAVAVEVFHRGDVEQRRRDRHILAVSGRKGPAIAGQQAVAGALPLGGDGGDMQFVDPSAAGLDQARLEGGDIGVGAGWVGGGDD